VCTSPPRRCVPSRLFTVNRNSKKACRKLTFPQTLITAIKMKKRKAKGGQERRPSLSSCLFKSTDPWLTKLRIDRDTSTQHYSLIIPGPPLPLPIPIPTPKPLLARPCDFSRPRFRKFWQDRVVEPPPK
jgi:hypothetical protein